jgi:hypothetical protein
MSEENKPEDEELEGSEEELDEDEEGTEEDGSEEETEESSSSALAGLAGAAAAGALARKGGKKPVKGKATAKGKKGAKPAPAKPAAKPAPSISKDGSVDVNAKIDEIQKLTDKNTVWTVAGYSFTPAKLMILGTILSTALGGLYGAFEVYKDYQDMKTKIAKYVAPDLSEIYKKVEIAEQNSEKSVQYTQDIKNDLKGDIRRLESTVDTVERTSKATERELSVEMRTLRKETELAIKETNSSVDKKIQRALDNPLAGK